MGYLQTPSRRVSAHSGRRRVCLEETTESYPVVTGGSTSSLRVGREGRGGREYFVLRTYEERSGRRWERTEVVKGPANQCSRSNGGEREGVQPSVHKNNFETRVIQRHEDFRETTEK